MEFRHTYPNTQPYNTSSLEYFDRYTPTIRSFSLSSSSSPSDSYAVPTLETDAVGPIDAVIAAFEPQPADGLDSFFAAKKRFAAKSVEEILGQIYEREQIKYGIFQDLDQEHMQLSDKLLEMPDWPLGLNSQIDRNRVQLLRELSSFEKERRMEYVACWRDIVRLKGDLREALREFDQEIRKEDLLR